LDRMLLQRKLLMGQVVLLTPHGQRRIQVRTRGYTIRLSGRLTLPRLPREPRLCSVYSRPAHVAAPQGQLLYSLWTHPLFIPSYFSLASVVVHCSAGRILVGIVQAASLAGFCQRRRRARVRGRGNCGQRSDVFGVDRRGGSTIFLFKLERLVLVYLSMFSFRRGRRNTATLGRRFRAQKETPPRW